MPAPPAAFQPLNDYRQTFQNQEQNSLRRKAKDYKKKVNPCQQRIFPIGTGIANKSIMHTEQQIQDIGILNKGLQLLNIDVSLKPVGRTRHPLVCRFINNADGSLRWIWPASSRRPQFLRFHNQGTEQAKWYARIIRTGFALKLPRLVTSGTRTIYTSAIGERSLRQVKDWAIFTGTAGINRKLMIWHEDEKGQSAFTKLSLTIPAAKNIYAERSAIMQPVPEGIVAPETIHTRCLAFTQGDLFNDKVVKPVRALNELPLSSLQRWLGCDLRNQRMCDASWYRDAQAWLQVPRRFKDDPISEVLLQKMRTLIECMLPQAMVPVARAHGDFIPCNVRLRGDQILLIDWELSRDDMPALYDLFHFIYQDGILSKRQPFAAIRKEIDETLRQPEWEAFLIKHEIDPNEAEQQYLLSTISYYLQAYSQQAKWHHHVPLLTQVWCEALGFWMDYEGLLTQRQLVLQDVAHFMHSRPYAAMKLSVDDITALPNAANLDLCMPFKAAAELKHYLSTHRCVERIREKRQSFIRQLSLFLNNGSIIHIDCSSAMRHGKLVFADAAKTWDGARLNEAGMKVPTTGDDMRYTRLFYLLNRSAMPQSYRDHYLSQNMNVQSDLLRQMREEGAAENKNFAALLQYDDVNRERAVAFLKTMPANRGWAGIWHRMQHTGDRLRKLIPHRGYIITFSGVDGPGKSTVIEATRHRIDKELRTPVVVLRHRPSMLPVLSGVSYQQQGATATLQPKAAKLSRIGTYMRFAYYYTDYLFGQCYVQLRYVMRGYVVLYDRYYFDFISDSKRNNIMLPSAFTTWWYRFLFEPDLNFFLYPPLDSGLPRKQELDAASIEQLTGKYLALFNKLEQRSGHGHYISVRNMRLGDTLDTLFNHIKTREASAA